MAQMGPARVVISDVKDIRRLIVVAEMIRRIRREPVLVGHRIHPGGLADHDHPGLRNRLVDAANTTHR
jgi:hypothetical protein